MRLATFTDDAGTRLGVVVGDGIVDLARHAPELPRRMIDLLVAGDSALAVARAASSAASIPMAQVRLDAPVPDPGKVLAIGLNYADHVAESGMKKPEHQMWFNKQRNCVTGPYAEIALPSVSKALDFEAELCVVIGKRCKHVPRERAQEVIAGYSVGNDVSVRDWQLRVPTMTIGKSFDTHGPLGPWLVTPDEVGDPHALELRCWVNGEQRQHSNTRHLIFDCYDQIAHLTQAFTLDPGDVIFTGTPAGVGVAEKPPRFLRAGDVVRIEIERIGVIENRVAPENTRTSIG